MYIGNEIAHRYITADGRQHFPLALLPPLFPLFLFLSLSFSLSLPQQDARNTLVVIQLISRRIASMCLHLVPLALRSLMQLDAHISSVLNQGSRRTSNVYIESAMMPYRSALFLKRRPSPILSARLHRHLYLIPSDGRLSRPSFFFLRADT